MLNMSSTNIDPSRIGSALADAAERVAVSVLHASAGGRLASAIVWSPDERLVVTTSRLFHGESDQPITLRLADGSSRSGELVGVDESSELALVRAAEVADSPLRGAEWADEGARPGLFVAPVARMRGGVSVTMGVVTRVGPAWVTARGGPVDSYIDVDGTLPPGFSGGPLIDFDGRVLGVNTRGLVPGGITLPTRTVRRVVEALVSGVATTPGHLGVAIEEVDLPEALRIEPEAARGLLVTAVMTDSAADKAGIQVGDVVVAIDGQPTTDHAHLLAALNGKVGKTVQVRLARHGEALDVEATPGERSDRRRHHHHGHFGHKHRGRWRGCR